MSTTLYNGLRVKDEFYRAETSLQDFMEIVSLVARIIQERFKTAALELVSEQMAEFIMDSKKVSEQDADAEVFRTVKEAWEKEQKKFGSHHMLNDPLRFSIHFGLSNKGNLLAYYFSNHSSGYIEALESLGIFEDYHYQNQSDHPEEFTDEQWDARGAEWDSVLNESGSFSHLPGWSLSDTTDPFMSAAMSTNDVDVNGYATERRRNSRAYQEKLFKILLHETEDRPMTAYHRANKVIYEKFTDNDFLARLSPLEPLPNHTFFTFGELPEPVKIDKEILAELVEIAQRTE